MANQDDQWEYPDQPYDPPNGGTPGTGCPDGSIWNGNRCEEQNQGGGGGAYRDCPDGQIFNGMFGCVDECPDGQARNGEGDCVDLGLDSGGGSGGSGGSGSGGGGRRPTTPFDPPAPYEMEPWNAPAPTPLDLRLGSEIDSMLGDWDKRVPYTDKVITNQKASAFRSAHGRDTANRNAINADAILRGVFGSDHTGDRQDNMRRGADSQYAEGVRDIENNAAVQNDAAMFRNRTAAIDRAQQHVDNERNFLLTSEMSHFQRQQGLAEISLAYYRLAQERWALENNLGYNYAALGQNQSQFDSGMNWQVLQALLGATA